MAAGTAPTEIIIKLLFFKKLFIYLIPNKNPIENNNTPKVREIINNSNALKNLNFLNKSYASKMNVEKVLKLPNTPIEKNNPN